MENEKVGIDSIIFRALDAISKVPSWKSNNSDLDAVKCRIFWRTLREIADNEIKKDNIDFPTVQVPSKILAALLVNRGQKDKEMEIDGRKWMPMHFAMTVPNVSLNDIQILFDQDPEIIQQRTPRSACLGSGYTPCHLAVMVTDPNMALIKRLKVFDPDFGTRLTDYGRYTPLHLAARLSNSSAVIQELIRLCPETMAVRNSEGRFPMRDSLDNHTDKSSDILQAFVDAAPVSEITADDSNTLLHAVLHNVSIYDSRAEALTTILVKAFPDSVNTLDWNQMLPIQIAAYRSSTSVLKTILEANPENLKNAGDVAHQAVTGDSLSNLAYLHSVSPEVLLSVDEYGHTPLELAIGRTDYRFIYNMLSFCPEAASTVDDNGNNMLHYFADYLKYFEGTFYGVDILRLFIRHLPRGAISRNQQGETPYDILDSANPDHFFFRRLLLLAGAPSLHSEILKQMNYEDRKGALLAFFGTREPGKPRDDRVDICHRIRHGAGAMELMRQIVSFL